MFNNLRELTIREFTNRKETAKTLLEQNLTTAMYYYTTKLRQQQYHNHEITKEKAKEITKKAIEKYYNNNLKKELEKMDVIANADDLEKLELFIDYNKRVSAHVTINNNNRYITKAPLFGNSNKLDEAGTSALNASVEIKKALYSAIEKHLSEGVNIKQIEQFLGYGVYYDYYPSFMNGAGIDSCMRIFQNLGFKVEERQLNNARLYTIERKGQQ